MTLLIVIASLRLKVIPWPVTVALVTIGLLLLIEPVVPPLPICKVPFTLTVVVPV